MSTYQIEGAPASSQTVNVTENDLLASPQEYYDGGDIAWMLASSALVLTMNLAVSLMYSGMSRTSALRMIWLPTLTTFIVGFIWFLFGYSIAFSPSGNVFWGGSSGLALKHALIRPVGNPHGPKLPELVYALYQGMFACFTACLVSGAAIYKGTISRFVTFIVFWTLFVYCPIAHWTWNPEGWSAKWGVYDFAGGTPVHICAGCSAAAYNLYYRRRIRSYNNDKERQASEHISPKLFQAGRKTDPLLTITGTMLMWVGWMGFNGGSALGANLRAVSAVVATTVAACSGATTAYLIDLWYSEDQGNPDDGEISEETLQSTVDTVCTGAVAGMVAITPAAGFVPYYYAPIFGFMALPSYYAIIGLNKYMFDPLGVFSIHAVPGFLGMFLTGIFASAKTAKLDGYTINLGGGIDGHWKQLYMQLADACAGAGYSFVVSFIILLFLDLLARVFRKVFSSKSSPHPPRYVRYDMPGVYF